MNQLPLLPEHEKLSPRMGEFAGWNMPLFYENATAEHSATREKAGMFDISHMGQVHVSGDQAEEFLNSLFTNDVSKLKIGRSHYSFLLNEQGGVIDDLILYRISEKRFFIVFNGARIAEAYEILTSEATSCDGLEILWNKDVIGLSIQGPRVEALCDDLVGCKLPEKRNIIMATTPAVIASTGYTGERGFEWFGPVEEGVALWQKAIELGVTPCGLVSRDGLRLEAGLPLNGQDLTRETSPVAAGLGFAVKLQKKCDFRGKEALGSGAFFDKKLIGFTSTGPIPRTGYEVQNASGEVVGAVSSGGRPPGSKASIGLAWVLVDAVEQELLLSVRGKAFPLTITQLPFM